MNILADENLALVDYFFAGHHVIPYAGRKINAEVVAQYQPEALLIRSVTQVAPCLVADSSISFIGSATIGTDHVAKVVQDDPTFHFSHASGCNAQAVAEYVVTALVTLRPEVMTLGQSFVLGIVGLGNVGQKLAGLALAFGWKVYAVDPFQTERPDNLKAVTLTSLEQVLIHADAVSLHVPITYEGEHQTYHLMNTARFSMMKPHAILINSARGAVVSEQALLADYARTQRLIVLDVFEHEPVISSTVLDSVAIATPHIAGYSLEGKANGTLMIYQAFCRWQGDEPTLELSHQLPNEPQWFDPNISAIWQLPQLLPQLYPILRDDSALRALVVDHYVNAEGFDALRKYYPLRREWRAYGFSY